MRTQFNSIFRLSIAAENERSENVLIFFLSFFVCVFDFRLAKSESGKKRIPFSGQMILLIVWVMFVGDDENQGQITEREECETFGDLTE